MFCWTELWVFGCVSGIMVVDRDMLRKSMFGNVSTIKAN